MKSILLVVSTTLLSLLLATGYQTPHPHPCGSLHQVMHFYGYRPSELDTIVLAWYEPDGSFSNLLGAQNIFMDELERDYAAQNTYFLSGHPDPVTIFDRANPIDSIQLWNEHLVPQDDGAGRLCDIEVILLPTNRRVRFSNIQLGDEHTLVPERGCDHRVISSQRDDGEQGYMVFAKN